MYLGVIFKIKIKLIDFCDVAQGINWPLSYFIASANSYLVPYLCLICYQIFIRTANNLFDSLVKRHQIQKISARPINTKMLTNVHE